MTDSVNVIVVGGGIIGCSAAYYLSRSGARVRLYDKEAIGSGASAHATGSLSLLGAEFTEGSSFQFALSASREFPPLVKDLEAATGADLLFQQRPSLRLALDDERSNTDQRPHAVAADPTSPCTGLTRRKSTPSNPGSPTGFRARCTRMSPPNWTATGSPWRWPKPPRDWGRKYTCVR